MDARGRASGGRCLRGRDLARRIRDGRSAPADGRHVGGKWQHSVVGQGGVGLVDVSRALAARGYDGWVALETHYRPAPTGADLSSPRGETFSELGEQGTRACLEGWAEVLRQAGST